MAVAVTALALLRAGLGSRALTAGVSLLLVTATAGVLMPRWHGLARLSRYVGAALLVAAREPQRSGAGG